jgi:hypothetical protein
VIENAERVADERAEGEDEGREGESLQGNVVAKRKDRASLSRVPGRGSQRRPGGRWGQARAASGPTPSRTCGTCWSAW